MAARASRKLAARRDRRKAKASGWKRGPKRRMRRVAHGET